VTDPFLLAHRVLPSFYLIGHPVSPISIRDQMVRGCMLIHRAFENGLITKDDPILVVGAGAGGASAAIRAAELGARVHLVDLAPGPFLVQARSRTRWLDPTQYDWPAGHWGKAHYPWDPSVRLPLFYPALRADNLAVGWTFALNAAATALYGRLSPHYNTRVTAIVPVRDEFDVTFNPPIPGAPSKFPFILWATGFGTELCGIPPGPAPVYRGHPFWDTDKLEDPDCGLPSTPKVLITGSGDGALQDFLRVATKLKSAEEIFRKAAIPQDIATRLSEHEDRARREIVWADGSRHDHEVHWRLDSEHLKEVNYALTLPAVQAGLRSIFPHPREEIVLAYPCNHLSPQLALNRFLAHLIHEYVSRPRSGLPASTITFVDSVSATGVSGTGVSGHTCVSPGTCHGVNHKVHFDQRPLCYRPTLLGSPATPATCDAEVLVVRYGIDRSAIAPPLPAHLLRFLNLHRSRHILPYHPC
jgi:FAD binding domain